MKPCIGKLLLLGAAALLPGCLAVNAALGVLGLVGPPAAQLAGAAYTVAEYSYEYQVHHRTPDQVLAAKFDWLTGDGEQGTSVAADGPGPTLVAEVAAPSRRDEVNDGASAEGYGAVAADESDVVLADEVLSAPAGAAVEPVAASALEPSPEPFVEPVVAAETRLPVVRAVAVASKPEPIATVRALPGHVLVPHEPDPLLVRLDRIENGLAKAEALLLADGGEGVRLSVPPCDGDPCAQGVNGSWSLRLPVMQTVPDQSQRPSARSRNT